ncbi:OmpA family protein [Cognatishimia sp. F0-27]|uniref:OmpA family protein n=1 Tax=Cognatishimia sp. F0-27 TaxID=2816855 RepID=UPI001D0CD09A|nr:OmpA family protein [Cognatishimia sp. F0-27]MCC1492223.1 OmpA family protein [Cognatishimia sp. F0-27]
MKPLLTALSFALVTALPLAAPSPAPAQVFIPGEDDTITIERAPRDPLAACLLNADSQNCAAAALSTQNESGGMVFESTADIAYETLVLDLDEGKVTKTDAPPPAPVDYAEPKPKDHGRVALPSVAITIEFDYNSHLVRGDQRGKLASLIKAMQDPALQGAQYAVIGHTDAKGSFAYNCDLSRRRAAEVTRALEANYVLTPLYPVGFGEYVLKDAAYPDAAANRRVTFLRLPDHAGEVLRTAQSVCG